MDVVRVWLQTDGGAERIGHLAQIIKSKPDKGFQVLMLTTAHSNDTHWLPTDRQGVLWQWLQQLQIQVSYHDDDDSPTTLSSRQSPRP